MKRTVGFIALIFLIAAPLACESGPQPADRQPAEVVVYVSLDEIYSRPILDAFEQQTGIRVRAVYDTEAAKTTGLVNRIRAERDRPRADVFWNNEVVQTLGLANDGLLAPYVSPNAETISVAYKDPGGLWTGFAARARVVIYNTDLVDDPPHDITDLADPKWRGRACIANPLFGTTATHVAVLYALWGADETEAFLLRLEENEIAILPSNGAVRDLVASGEYAAGLTDTDDANGAVEDGFPVQWHVTGQQAEGQGALLIPNSVALIHGAPNPEAGRALVDYLLRPETEAALARTRSIQIPLHTGVQAPENVPSLAEIALMPAPFAEAAGLLPRAATFVQQRLIN